MRTSTLAALLVASGTIAALPFRRFSADLDPDGDATEPTVQPFSDPGFALSSRRSGSVGESASLGELAAADQIRSSNTAGRIRPSRPGQSATAARSVSQPSVPSGSPQDFANHLSADRIGHWLSDSADHHRERHVEMPLTFDDLMLPIDRPKPIAEQFTAVMERTKRPDSHPSQMLRSERGVMGPRSAGHDELNRIERDPSESRFGRFDDLLDDSEQRHLEPDLPAPVSGTFASSRIQADADQPSQPPLAPPATIRDRQWIRQPRH